MADPLSRLSSEQKEIAGKIRDTCESLGVDPNFGLAIGWAENRFRTGDNLESGAIGPMQVMPSNAKGLGLKTADLNNVDKNIEAGCKILKENLDAFGGDSKLAAIAYNSKPATAKSYLDHQDDSRLPNETQNYLKTLNTVYEIGSPATIAAKDTNIFEQSEAPEVKDKTTTEPDLFGEEDTSFANQNEKPTSGFPTKEIIAGTTGVGALAGTAEVGAGPFKKLLGTKPLVDAGSPGQKWASKTGYGKGAGYSVQEVARAYEKAKNKGKISGKLAPGETLNIHDWSKQKELADELARKSGTKEALSKTSKVLGKIPLGSTLAGYSGGIDIAEALERASKGNITGAAIKGVSGLGSMATLAPHPIPRLLGGALTLGAMPAEYMYETMQENKRRQAQGLAPASRGQQEIQYDPMGNPIY